MNYLILLSDGWSVLWMGMCFSATASFIAGGVLATLGGITLKQATTARELPFASIPLLFGIQQTIEGVVWLSFGHSSIHSIATYAYGMFSNVLWPLFVPLAVLLLEKDPERKKIIRRFAFLGVAISLYLLYFIITGGITSEILNNCIAYHSPVVFLYPAVVLYLVAICGSCLYSSYKTVNMFGIVAFVSATITAVLFLEMFLSVWCFFSAILSIIICWHFWKERKLQ